MNHQLKQDKQDISVLIGSYIKNLLSKNIKYININMFDEIINETIKSNIDAHLSELLANVQEKILQEIQLTLSKEAVLPDAIYNDDAKKPQENTKQQNSEIHAKETYDLSDIALSPKDEKTFMLSKQAIKKMLK